MFDCWYCFLWEEKLLFHVPKLLYTIMSQKLNFCFITQSYSFLKAISFAQEHFSKIKPSNKVTWFAKRDRIPYNSFLFKQLYTELRSIVSKLLIISVWFYLPRKKISFNSRWKFGVSSTSGKLYHFYSILSKSFIYK